MSEIIEALKSLGELDDPFAQLRSVSKGQIIFVNMMVWLLQVSQWVVPITVYYLYGAKRIVDQNAKGTWYEKAWQGMVLFSMIAFIPSTVMYFPSHAGNTWMNVYFKTLDYSAKASGFVLGAVLTFLGLDKITMTSEDTWDKDAWMFALIFTELNLLLGWVVPHFKLDQAAALLYFWDFIQDSKQQFDEAVTMNEGEGEEIPDGVNELIATF